jgi:hypothetical protein
LMCHSITTATPTPQFPTSHHPNPIKWAHSTSWSTTQLLPPSVVVPATMNSTDPLLPFLDAWLQTAISHPNFLPVNSHQSSTTSTCPHSDRRYWGRPRAHHRKSAPPIPLSVHDRRAEDWSMARWTQLTKNKRIHTFKKTKSPYIL